MILCDEILAVWQRSASSPARKVVASAGEEGKTCVGGFSRLSERAGVIPPPVTTTDYYRDGEAVGCWMEEGPCVYCFMGEG